MPQVLIARPRGWWPRVPLAVIALAAQVTLGLLVLVLRTVRVVVGIATDGALYVEQRLAKRTGRPALSHTGIAALAMAFAHEFHAAYRAPAR